MPAALTTSLFIFAAFLILISQLAAVLVAGLALLWQTLHFFYEAGTQQGALPGVTIPKEFDTPEDWFNGRGPAQS